jgi:cephalosporin hydroxylase
MIYELKIAFKTVRNEGLKPLFTKILLYFRQLISGIRFLLIRPPHGSSPEAVVNFAFNAANGLITPGQVRSEIIQMAALIQQRKPRVVVEIGTANGGTLVVWCAMADPTALILSLDLPGGVHGGGYPYWKSFVYKRFRQPGQTLHLIRADSHQPESLVRLRERLPKGGVDFLFIDGDHTYQGVKADFEMYSPLVRPGGLIALHDICVHPPELDCHVDEFWAEIRTRYKCWEYVEDPKQGGFGIGLIEV